MTYKVLSAFQVKANGKLIEFREGQEIALPEEKAAKLIEQGKIVPTVINTITEAFERKILSVKPSQENADKPAKYQPTEKDMALEGYIGKVDLNPNGYKCIRCGAIAGRYCLGEDHLGKTWWGWQCLKCRPHIEPERN